MITLPDKLSIKNIPELDAMLQSVPDIFAKYKLDSQEELYFLIEKSNPLFLAGDCLLWEKCSTEKISPCLLFCAAIHCCCIVAKKFGTNLAKSSE